MENPEGQGSWSEIKECAIAEIKDPKSMVT
jgi:hypothetical protein